MTVQQAPLPSAHDLARALADLERNGGPTWENDSDEARTARVWELASLRAARGKGHGPEVDPLEAVALSDFLAELMQPASWLVDGVVPSGPAIGALIGAYKNGKSLLGLQACFAVASPAAGDLLGHTTDHHGPTLFIEYEGSRVRLQGRLAGMATKYGADAPVAILHRPPMKIDTGDGEAWLLRQCTDRVLCVIGPVAKCATLKNENDPAEWQALAERLQRITDATGCTIVLIHHTRKPSIDFGKPRKVDDFFNSARGSNSYMGAVDFAVGVQRDPEDTEGTVYYLERDGESGRLAMDFDVQSLCVWPSDRPLQQPTAQDRVEATYVYIEAHPGCTRRDLAGALDVDALTVRNYLVKLGARVTEEGDGNATRTYRVA